MNAEQNKSLILQYNQEVVQNGNVNFFKQIAAPHFVNHSAPDPAASGVESMTAFFTDVLHEAFSNLTVDVLDMVADEQIVATRKQITGTHTGNLLGIAPTGKQVTIRIIDFIRLEDGKLTEHWGENNFYSIIQSLKA